VSELTNDELRKLAEGARSTIKWGHALGQFRKVATPERILALLDEVDHLLEMHVSLLAIRPTRGELLDENERLRAEDASWEEREAACCPEDVGFEDMIRYLRGDVARLRAALIEIRGNTVISPGLGYGCRTVVNAIRELVDAALASVKDGDA